MMSAACQHEDFQAHVNVGRITDAGQPLRFVADVTISCVQCREPFRFLGVESGMHFEKPTVSIDGLELHAPIEPELVKTLHTRSRYTMPPEIPR
jgi:hypothetical protein